jgi:hypothetical protein
VENWLWKRLWSCRKTDYEINGLKVQLFMSCPTAQHPSSSRVPESYPLALKMKAVRSTETSGITNSAAQPNTSEVLNLKFVCLFVCLYNYALQPYGLLCDLG